MVKQTRGPEADRRIVVVRLFFHVAIGPRRMHSGIALTGVRYACI